MQESYQSSNPILHRDYFHKVYGSPIAMDAFLKTVIPIVHVYFDDECADL